MIREEGAGRAMTTHAWMVARRQEASRPTMRGRPCE